MWHNYICFKSIWWKEHSDAFVTNDCGILNLLEPGDEVKADKWFSGIKIIVDEKHLILVMPPFMHDGVFTENEIINTYNITL